jgi:P pilus assembly chaperone PapD
MVSAKLLSTLKSGVSMKGAQQPVFGRMTGFSHADVFFSLREMHSGKPHLTIANPTPYFATIGSLRVVTGGVSEDKAVEMMAPFSRVTLELDPFPSAAVGNAEILFALVNDDGNLVLGKRMVAPE